MTKGLKQIAKRRRKALERAKARTHSWHGGRFVTVLTSISAGRNP